MKISSQGRKVITEVEVTDSVLIETNELSLNLKRGNVGSLTCNTINGEFEIEIHIADLGFVTLKVSPNRHHGYGYTEQQDNTQRIAKEISKLFN